MFLDEKYLKENPEKVEEIEKSTLMIPSGLPGGTPPTRNEKFRVRLSFDRLKRKAAWRVQVIPMPPDDFHWNA
jgi:hypothetical protein